MKGYDINRVWVLLQTVKLAAEIGPDFADWGRRAREELERHAKELAEEPPKPQVLRAKEPEPVVPTQGRPEPAPTEPAPIEKRPIHE